MGCREGATTGERTIAGARTQERLLEGTVRSQRHSPEPSMSSVHQAAASGFAATADVYARGRPDYPAALDAWLRDRVGLAPDRIAVDLGAGTGKFIPRLASTGAALIAVEPVDAMRSELARRFPHVDARAGTADALPLDGASLDAVVCAQAFHWFATPDAVAEIARVLRPGGILALVWNVRDESLPWVRRLTGLFSDYEGDAPRFHKGDWRRVFPAPASACSRRAASRTGTSARRSR